MNNNITAADRATTPSAIPIPIIITPIFERLIASKISSPSSKSTSGRLAFKRPATTPSGFFSIFSFYHAIVYFLNILSPCYQYFFALH
jgi:hypothetical protein